MPRRLRAAQHGVIRQAGGVELGCPEILELEVREFLQDIGVAHPGPEHLEDILHANPHSPDAGSTPALIRIDRDAFEQVHAGTMAARAVFAKLGDFALVPSRSSAMAQFRESVPVSFPARGLTPSSKSRREPPAQRSGVRAGSLQATGTSFGRGAPGVLRPRVT